VYSRHPYSLDGAEVGAVSLWALDELLKMYEHHQANVAADFYQPISGLLHQIVLHHGSRPN
jgi:hypothetical protein